MIAPLLAALLALTSACSPTPAQSVPAPQTGIAKYYAPNAMQRVFSVRLRQGLIPPAYTHWKGALGATTNCSRIGHLAAVQFWNPRAQAWTRPEAVLLVDCSANADRARHVRENLVLEVGWETAVEGGWQRDGRTLAKVWMR